ncbi:MULTISPECIES: AraC family transcriptional regulator [Vibrio]|uniref:AraC family transcriptional regulator n=7 Tax=Vibrio TaxID=662 RepID=A0A2N7NII7_9VIBR|nr:AraC family transcriptional regulator [Vibrio tasmaniensis]PMP14726.1 AraC family transcriptional regulator [Vibrio tasmaniensis]TKG36124.1 helix-turn-helix transcriptional regulator [Vibrio tasmaniensis]TKG42555.1 helix-turn-helix transcriptional regulator [Vibrio tasmaniensis]TKG49239.1 helix-turn-helix transcriptional regulator [Vibrio tasmaniensis]TKG50948.1 helix-turn-helix transcriptional regulator [Vibrio tasmaniensis]
MKIVTPLLSDKDSDFNSVIINKIGHYFSIKNFKQDISIISNLDVRLVFFILNSADKIQLLTMALSICENLNKRIVIICSDPLPNIVRNHKNIFFIIETNSNHLTSQFEELKAKTQHMFESHFDIDRDTNNNNQLPVKVFTSEVINFVMDNINKEIRETEIAEKCHCSTTYFSKKFHLHFGVSFRDFVCDKRILLAKKLIEADTESKIAVIAYQCGYKDVSYFSRIFKKRTGVTPASYRRACTDNGKQRT